jgi:hypothetical protein
MTVDLLLLAAAVMSVIVIFSGVLVLGDMQESSEPQKAQTRRGERPF